MEQKLNKLYSECIKELNNIGLDILNEQLYGKIDIALSKRNNKRYANLINANYGYDISRGGNKKQDFKNSNLEYNEIVNYRYKITCNGCRQEFYRQRLSKSFSRRYRCAKCGGKFEIMVLN